MKRYLFAAVAALVLCGSPFATAGPVDDNNHQYALTNALPSVPTYVVVEFDGAAAVDAGQGIAAETVSASEMTNDDTAAVLGVRPGVARRFANFASSAMTYANDDVAENDTRAGQGDRHGVTRSSS